MMMSKGVAAVWGRRALSVVMFAALTGLAACETAYYSAMESVGYHKRDLLVDRVEDAMGAQEAAKEEFASALERFSSVVNVGPSELKDTYEKLNDSYEDAADRAEAVTDHIDEVEDVSGDLFKEWRNELEEISNTRLRSSSESQLKASEAKYEKLIRAMRRAEGRMAPVLTAFKDNVLFLKHNLNAQAIASLRTELDSVENSVGSLIRDMEASIAESQAFIKDMELLQ